MNVLCDKIDFFMEVIAKILFFKELLTIDYLIVYKIGILSQPVFSNAFLKVYIFCVKVPIILRVKIVLTL
jgi:hypothetical protein